MAMAVASSLSPTLVTSALPHCASSPISQAPRAHPSGALFSRSASSFCGGSLLKSRVGGRREAGRRGRGRGGERFNNRTQLIRAAALSQSVDAYRRVGAPGGDNVDVKRLVQALEEASAKGREVVMAAVDKPRSIDYKGATDLVTDTDRKSEEAILAVVRKYFPDHLILGEEGGVSGDPTSEYLWCIDPLDGTTNFAQNYPSFAVSIAVLHKGRPIAAAVVEFAGGPFIWDTRTFTASSGGGAFCNGRQIHVSIRDQVERSLFVTGFGYEHDAAWATNIDLFKEFTDKSRGVRRLGAAAVDMCHVALGIVEGYWEYRLKPWDMAAGVLIVEEAGGKVTRMDGGDFCVFERSVLVSNGTLHNKLVERISPPTQKLIKDGFDFSQWYKPSGYISEV